jgi:hypothetical protein
VENYRRSVAAGGNAAGLSTNHRGDRCRSRLWGRHARCLLLEGANIVVAD